MSDGDITTLLARASSGDEAAAEALMPVVYADLKRRANAIMARESASHTLQATALVHEAYVRLVAQDRVDWKDRAHFFAVSSHMMRRIMVDHARARLSEKRGSGRLHLSLDEGLGLSSEADADVVALNDALTSLAQVDPKQADLVVLRFFGGLTVEEVAAVQGVSKRAVEAEWTMVKAWLRRELSATP